LSADETADFIGHLLSFYDLGTTAIKQII